MIVNLPLKKAATIAAGFGERVRKVARYGERRSVEGRLTSQGAPLTNQTVRVVETFAAGSRSEQREKTARTDGDGRFKVRVSSGPSRSVQVFYDGSPTVARCSSPALGMKVKGKVSLAIRPKVLHNGGLARMRGRVGFRGALPPARGKLVAIQFLDPARRKWRPVEVLRTDRRGRFRYGYRFRTIASAQRIVFRANVLPEAGWPYLPSTSRPRSVIVYPKDQLGK